MSKAERAEDDDEREGCTGVKGVRVEGFYSLKFVNESKK